MTKDSAEMLKYMDKFRRMKKALLEIRELEYKYSPTPNGLTTLIDKALGEEPSNNQIKTVCEGLQIQHGTDGHWLCFKQGNRHGIINIENALTEGIAQSVIIDWIDAQLAEKEDE